MLHRINFPVCNTELSWVVQLQGDLLHALCHPSIKLADVTVDWVKGVRSDVNDDWMGWFCGWSPGGKSMRARMKSITSLSVVEKQSLVRHYEANLQFPNAFDDAKPDPPAATALPDDLTELAASAYRDFFDMFYAPIFYRNSTRQGYPVDGGDLDKRFSKSVYLDAYHKANKQLAACPLCDGSMDGAELDHWLAKQHLPELNCHPLNLVEICPTCNSVTHKGQKLALDENSAKPFEEWFHPLLRPAAGQFDVRVGESGPYLFSDDRLDQIRLQNLDALVDLSGRWKKEFRIRMKNTRLDLQTEIEHAIRKGKLNPEEFAGEGMVEWLKSHLEKERYRAINKRGRAYYQLLQAALLHECVREESKCFKDLCRFLRVWIDDSLGRVSTAHSVTKDAATEAV